MNHSNGSLVLVVCTVAEIAAASSIAHAQYAVFDSTHDTIAVPGNTVVGTAFTMEARVRPVSGQSLGRIYAEQFGAQEDKGIYVGDQAVAGLAWTGASYFTGIVATTEICPNEWHHVAFVRDDGEERMYLDGKLLITRAWDPAIANSPSSPRSIGGFQYTLGGPFEPAVRGAVDYVRVSNSVRYAGPTFTPPLESHLVSDGNTLLLYKFNEAPGSTTVMDSGPGGHTGTVGIGFTGATAPTFTGSLPSSADINGDGSVDGDDLAVVLGQWGPCAPDTSACTCPADLNDDGVVDGNDLTIVLGGWTG